jgi:anti-sigma regulatory factor (Ser/Thr protein kinase)
MSSSLVADHAQAESGFRHEAFFYAGEREFLSGTTAFLRQAVRADEPVLVVVSARKIDLLREQLSDDATRVRFADMGDVGTNPARIIPAWTAFVDEHGDRPLRGIGEPIWAERSPAELVECQRHESLLNVAFSDHCEFVLLCPYDTSALRPDVVDEARRSHPYLRQDGSHGPSADYRGTAEFAIPFAATLPEPPPSSVEFAFGLGSLGGVRSLVVGEARRAGLGERRAADAMAAVNEVASNSMRHGGGSGVLRIWTTADSVICEVTDRGYIDEPLVGRMRPGVDRPGGRGLWMVNQLCDLVQVRSHPTGTTIRMHVRRDPA